jgi:hypothetical protein
MRHILLALAVASVSIVGLPSITAQAQPRVFVAAQGSDANPCTFALPCRTFQRAHDVVAAKGEIDVLDPAGYGPVTISKSISIQGHGFSGISVLSGDAITISAGGADKINLRGLLIDGTGTGGNGIKFNVAGYLNIQDSLIRNFSGRGLYFAPTVASRLSMSNTVVSDNGSDGIFLFPSAGVTVIGVLEQVEIDGNGANGLIADSTGNNSIEVGVTVSNSVIAHNAGNGIIAQSDTFGGFTIIAVRNTTIAANGNTGLYASQGGATSPHARIYVSRSMITGNSVGWNASLFALFQSYGDNDIDNNGGGNSAPPTTAHK